MWKFLIIFFIVNYPEPTKALVEFNVTSKLLDSNKVITENRTYFEITTNSHIDFDVTTHFIFGFIFHSFECTFRIKNDSLSIPYLDDWYLFDVQSNFGNRFYIALSASRKELIFYANSYKDVSKIVFPNVEIFDGKWHSIMYTVVDRNFKLYIDCELRANKNNATKSKIEHINNIRSKRLTESEEYEDEFYDYSSPEIDVIEPKMTMAIAQGVNSKQTVPIDISKMRFHAYAQMPAYAGCEDVENSHRKVLNQPKLYTKNPKAFNHNLVQYNSVNKNCKFYLNLIISSIIFIFINDYFRINI